MYKVYKNVEMTQEGYLLGIEAEEASHSCAPGQYFELKLPNDKHRVPVVLTDILPERGIIKVVFRVINDSTKELSELADGGNIEEIFGPFGRKCPFLNEDMEGKQALVIAEDLGGAAAYMIIHDLGKKGAVVDAVAGGRSEGYLYLSEFTGELCRTYLNYSEDGTQGEQGTICQNIDDILTAEEYDICVIIGSIDMMEHVAAKAQSKGIKTWISLDPAITSIKEYKTIDHVVINGKEEKINEGGTVYEAAGVDFADLRKQI
ncbi:hypothetical protein C3B58_14230 [Lactonifactor longoviformis]|uniref:Ferredoxin--NADP+ reductase n=2 Tax=Lactonifactor TaxID=420345 RepID=A0A1M4URW8_9CLOT|nr:hypothetical protein [Lactonifactor longoviformis]POP31948.1 hypothetical protein C3B58_14230 [Lactonifactor longoviformis]SHE59429.1 ferredoxin--NADP+ reductase [Lactonifactor longoviformis DSM 17459]